jgi:hypothetical protein
MAFINVASQAGSAPAVPEKQRKNAVKATKPNDLKEDILKDTIDQTPLFSANSTTKPA